MHKIILFAIITIILTSSSLASPDFRNFYGIAWKGNACDNLRYAQSMGYDYVAYQWGMEKCSDELKAGLYFYFLDPEMLYMTDHFNDIDLRKTYTQNEINSYDNFFAWKGTATQDTQFPNNLASGWWFTNVTFRANPDFQQQKIIDESINHAIAEVSYLENKKIGWLFGGYAWDVPDFTGDWWTGRQGGYTGQNWMCNGIPCAGTTGSIGMWNNGIDSSGLHSGITHEYSTYSGARIAMMTQLFSATKQVYPDMKIYYQPYNIYTFLKTITPAIKDDIMPTDSVYLCQESANSPTNDLLFMNDQRIYNTGMITKDYVCNDNPDNHDIDRSLILAGTAGINGGWTGWFGRIGGTGGTTSYTINDLPMRLKLIRAVATWDNINQVPLDKRNWDSQNLVYRSTDSFADMKIIYSTHPKNGNIYFVILDNTERLTLPEGKTTDTIYSANEFFEPTTDATNLFTINQNIISLNDPSNEGKAYIMTLKDNQNNNSNDIKQALDPPLDTKQDLQNDPPTQQHSYLNQNQDPQNIDYTAEDVAPSIIDTLTKIIVGTGSIAIVMVIFGLLGLAGFLLHKIR